MRPSSSSRRVSAASVNAGTSLGLVVERSNNPLDLGFISCTNLELGTEINVDSPAFDPKAYYQQLITGSSIVGLLHRENELLTGELAAVICAFVIYSFIGSRNPTIG